MKKRFLLILALALCLALAMVFTACKDSNDPNSEKPETTVVPTDVPATDDPETTPTEVPTATPEPTPEPTATPEPEPGTYDLLNFYPDEDHMIGDGWDIVDGVFCGPMTEPGTDPKGATLDGIRIDGHREVVAIDGPDGQTIEAIRLAIDGDAGVRWLGNRYGIGDIGLKPETRYKITATFYLGGSTVDGTRSVLGYATSSDFADAYMILEPKDEWQTVSFEFKTSRDLGQPNIVLGPDHFAGHCNYDYEISVAELSLYEVVGEETEVPAPDDLLHFEPTTSHVSGDGWEILDGKFSGPLQAPDIGTPNEAMTGDERTFAKRELWNTTLSNGKQGMVVRYHLEADYGFRNSGNFYGLGNIDLRPNTAYELTVVLQYQGTVGDRNKCIVGFLPNESDCRNTEAFTDKVELTPGDEWQTVKLEFTTPESMDRPCICVGPDSFIGEIYSGYNMMIESVTLYEKTAE